MSSRSSSTTDKIISQHDKLRCRLQNELSSFRSSLETGDYDWFLKGSNFSGSASAKVNSNNTLSPIKSPSMASSNNQKSPPTVSTTEANLLKKSNQPALVPLTRSKTADGYMQHRDSEELASSFRNGLKRTSTNSSNSGSSPISNSSRRASTSALLADSEVSVNKKRGGFFKKLFNKRDDDVVSPPRSRRSSIVAPSSSSYTESSRSRTDSVGGSKSPPPTKKDSVSCTPATNSGDQPLNSRSTQMDGFILPREQSFTNPTFDNNASQTLAAQYKYVDDPQLYEYLKDLTKDVLNMDKNDFNESSDSLDSAMSAVFAPSTDSFIKYDPNAIPPHPNKPKLPSAFALNPKYNKSIELEMYEKKKREKEQQQKESSMFGSFIRKSKAQQEKDPYALLKVLSHEANAADDASIISVLSSSNSTAHTKPPPKKLKAPPIKALSNLKPMKKVAFATTTFVNDPPQQIPSRHPRKGNVEVGEDGELIIHKVDPEEKTSTTSGIVVGGSAHLKLLTHSQGGDDNGDDSDAGSQITVDSTGDPNNSTSTGMKKIGSTSSMNSLDISINKQDKLLAAQKARQKPSSKDEENVSAIKDRLKIDKPMVKRKKTMSKPVVTLKLDELYTRCCHLREILPIPATLKQIPKGSTDPLPILQLRNPRPSLIEVLSFSDYIRIAPINCIALDGVSLTAEMFRILLSALASKRYLEKISLRNTPIDNEGWKLLCFFLIKNKAVRRLDLTQCPSLSLNTQRLKKTSTSNDTDPADRMQCNLQNRSDMDWSLLTATLMVRGGMEEMIISGCKINDLRVFKSFFLLALKHTVKVGLAYNELNIHHCNILTQWMGENPDFLGIDLGYNDLGSCLKPFIEYTRREKLKMKVALVSLNSCNLLDNEDTEAFCDSLSEIPTLRYLDISNNKKLFPSFMSKLVTYLPLFTGLARLSIDNNDLTPGSIIQLSETLPLLRSLHYLSISGNQLTEPCYMSLCHSLRNSNTIYSFDFDRDDVPPKYQEKIGLITIRNMERGLYGRENQENKLLKNLIASSNQIKSEAGYRDGKSFAELMVGMITDSSQHDKVTVNRFMSDASRLRDQLHNTINELTLLQAKNQLNFEGKETLIRLITIDSSIVKGLELINSKFSNMYQVSEVTKAVGELTETDGQSSAKKNNFPSQDSSDSSLNSSNTDGDHEVEAVEIKGDTAMNRTTSTASLMLEEEAKTFKEIQTLKQNSSVSSLQKLAAAASAAADEDSDSDTDSNSEASSKSPLLSKLKKSKEDGRCIAKNLLNKDVLKNALVSPTDILDLVNVLNNLKQTGVSISDIFSKNSSSSDDSNSNSPRVPKKKTLSSDGLSGGLFEGADTTTYEETENNTKMNTRKGMKELDLYEQEKRPEHEQLTEQSQPSTVGSSSSNNNTTNLEDDQASVDSLEGAEMPTYDNYDEEGMEESGVDAKVSEAYDTVLAEIVKKRTKNND